MQSSDIYRLLGRRARRGLIIFPILWVGCVAAAVWGSVTPGGRPWAVAAIFASILIYFAFGHVRTGNVLAWNVSENPHLVYWAQPNVLSKKFSQELIDFKFLTLHLRNGQQLEIHLPPTEMRKFIIWLNEQNPSVRWGPYDHPTPSTGK